MKELFYKPFEEKIYPVCCEKCKKDLKEKWRSEKEEESEKFIKLTAEIVVKGILILIIFFSTIYFLGWLIRTILGD